MQTFVLVDIRNDAFFGFPRKTYERNKKSVKNVLECNIVSIDALFIQLNSPIDNGLVTFINEEKYAVCRLLRVR